jgi:hypothetical protein
MKWMRGYGALMLLILAAYLYAEYRRPPRVDWTVTLDRQDRIPFGTYILYDRLSDLFDVKAEQPTGSVYERYDQRIDTGELAMFITKEFKTSPVDDAELLRFLALGNTLFLATEDVSKGMSDTLGIQLASFDPKYMGNDSIRLNLETPSLRKAGGYKMPTSWGSGHFSRFDTSRTTVLGRNSTGHANFIRIPVGRGEIYLHASPLVFSNISMLNDDNPAYVSDVLSYLPKHPTKLLWDDYFSSGRSGATTPLRVILTRPALRAGYFTALVAVLLLLLFRSKRRQRIIPVIPPPGNTTMDFVDTVGQLYLNRSHHQDIALKMIHQFLEYVREHYRLHTGMLDGEFTARLALRSGMDPERTKVFIAKLNKLRSGAQVGETELLSLSREIDAFKKSGT